MNQLPLGRLCSVQGTDKQFNFSVAITALELMKGLARVPNMAPYDGMIFDFGCDFSPIMTPSGLEFPVDLAFITAGGEIVEIHKLDPDYRFTQGTSLRNIQYALEVPVGFFDLHGIVVGDFLILNQ